MELKIISIETGEEIGVFTLKTLLDGQKKSFSVTVHDGDIRYFSFDDELKKIRDRNPHDTKVIIKLVSALYDGKIISLPVNLEGLR